MVAKNGATKKKGKGTRDKTQDPRLRLNQEMKNNLRGIHRHKTEIEELTKATIEELKKLQGLSKKAAASDSNSNHKFDLDYELTNLKMIKKILTLSTPFEIKQCEPKNKTKSRKKSAAPQKEKKLKKEGQEPEIIAKILIVEDDRTTIKIITHILEQHEFEVGYATDAEEGLKKTFKDKPDLILLDVMLPGMDGLQLLSKLQDSEETSRIPVIILSSLSGEKDILKGLERGATDYILKPFSPQILFFKIKKILSLKNEHLANNRHL